MGTTVVEPCAECPWRKANHGKRHPGGFYRKDNLRRLWNQIRKGGGVQSCHPTDPAHPDHMKYAGARPGAKPQECAGSLVLIGREIMRMNNFVADLGGYQAVLAYKTHRKQYKGLTKDGVIYYGLTRQMGPPMGGPLLPPVPRELIEADWIGRPDEAPIEGVRD